MWLTLLVTLLTYLLSPRDTAQQRRKALTNAAMAGGLTYAATEFTDWGSNMSDQFDEMIGVGPDGPAAGSTLTASGEVRAGGTPPASLWTTLTSWGPKGVAGVLATGAVVGSSSLRQYLPLLLAGAALLLLTR